MNNKRHSLPIVYTIIINTLSSIIILLLRVKQSVRQIYLNFKMSKFTFQLNPFYYHSQCSQISNSRLQRRFQNYVKHLRWHVLRF